MFKDRAEAGQKLARKLESYRGKDALVLALSRGGVVLGAEIAQALALSLDIIVTRKIGHLSNPEYAIGAVDEEGFSIWNQAEAVALNPKWLRAETAKQQAEARRRSTLYRQGRLPHHLDDKTVIIVDDGIATGLTMRLAVQAVRKTGAQKIVVAVPIAPPEAVLELKSEGADEVVMLEPPETFSGAVGAHYQEFEQVGDKEVIRLLKPKS